MEFPSLKTVLTVSTLAVVAVAATVYLTASSGSSGAPPRKTRESSGKKKRNHRPRKKSAGNLPDSAISSDLDPDATPESQAKEAKNKGNSLFAEKQYEDAIKSYTTAIELDAQAVYFNNRAACHVHLKEYTEGTNEF
jgi:tetratricopeptide (TPR) repeat protein